MVLTDGACEQRLTQDNTSVVTPWLANSNITVLYQARNPGWVAGIRQWHKATSVCFLQRHASNRTALRKATDLLGMWGPMSSLTRPAWVRWWGRRWRMRCKGGLTKWRCTSRWIEWSLRGVCRYRMSGGTRRRAACMRARSTLLTMWQAIRSVKFHPLAGTNTGQIDMIVKIVYIIECSMHSD